ncbi:UNVERIFIED_CONTAM: hypothetical protein Sradi_0656400 [Sesamum radiatum]|uniref:Uncharacterized protein n=1 Tax=Sesamum radiatum TaxID=300843 RepID=A0AAW2VMS5_SESRA
MRSMACPTSPKGIAAIVGVGPKLGRSIARKFAHEGYTVAILARDLGQYICRLSRFADEIAREEKAQVFAIRIDCSESRSIKEAFEGVLSLGFVEVLVYNAHHPPSWSPTSFADIRLDHFDKSLAVAAVGAFHCAQQVLPGMVERGRGTILFTGCSASLNGIPGFSDICCGKFAMRALSQCLASEFQPLGVHVAHVIIDGIIGAPRFITFLYLLPSNSLLDRVGEYYSIHFTAKMFFFFFRWGRTARQKRGRVDGPGRGGSDLLASARPGPVGLDSGD